MSKVLALLVIALTPTLAFASAKEDAAAAIARGISLRKQGNDEAALDEFQRARALSASPAASAQIGLAQQALGRWVEAEAEVREALSHKEDPWIAKNHVVLESALSTIKAHVGSLEVLGLPVGAEVLVEQRAVGVLPLPRPVRATAGTVALEVRAPGYLPVTRNISVSPGELSRETVHLAHDPGAAAAAKLAAAEMPAAGAGAALASPTASPLSSSPASGSQAPDQASGNGRSVAAWATGIGAGALLATGIVALVVRSDKNTQLENRINVDKTCAQMGDNFSGKDAATCVDLATAKDTWSWVAVGTFAGAGLAAAATILLVATRPAGGPDSASASASSSASGSGIPRVAAVVQPGLAFLSANWRF